MGWFAIAFLAGFLAYWQWEKQRQACVALLIVACIAAVLFAIGYACRYSLDLLLDRIGQGYVARILLGFALGNATAYFIEERTALHKAQLELLKAGAPPAPADDAKAAPSALEGVAGVSMTGLLWVAALILFFAIAAPHLDGWLRRMTSLKLPFGELQVASLSVHHSMRAESIDLMSDATSMATLSDYNERIRQDIEYITEFEIADLTQQKARDSARAPELARKIAEKTKIAEEARELYPVFDRLISPIAACIRDATDSGLAIDSVRLKARPMANALQHILFIDGKEFPEKEYTDAHEKFWTELKQLPGKIESYLDKDRRKDCSEIVPRYEGGLLPRVRYPDIRKYHATPYLHVAALLFALFMRDDDVALRVVEQNQNRLKFKDYRFLQFSGSLLNFRGGAIGTGLEMFDEMRRTSTARRDDLRDKQESCKQNGCTPVRLQLISEHLNRTRTAALLATNYLAYYVSDDLAQGGKGGERFAARLEDMASDIKKAIERGDDEDNRYSNLDTYAYAIIVLEARKKDPNTERIRKMIAELEKVVEFLDDTVSKSITANRYDINTLKIARAHLAFARELAAH